MNERHLAKLQKKISEVEKFIESILSKPIPPKVKKKILAELQDYKARLISGKGSAAAFKKSDYEN